MLSPSWEHLDMAIRALFFDFDGTLWDSETVGFKCWESIYADFGVAFPAEIYLSRLGTLGGRDPIAELETILGRSLDRDEIETRRRGRKDELLSALGPRPGVLDYLLDARGLGLSTAVVSTDDIAWVRAGLAQLGLLDGWDFIESADGDPSRAKPLPTLYLNALDRLALGPSEAIAIEDSPNGIRAAKGAGLFCLAVPTSVSSSLDLTAADHRVESLADLPLGDLLSLADDE